MGYTHYFETVGQAPTDSEWNQIVAETKKVFKKHKEILCRECDTPKESPIADVDEIFFNGKGNDGHETFVLERTQKGFNFCKTAQKPYDAAVVEVLRAVKAICPNWLRLASDGDEKDFKIFD